MQFNFRKLKAEEIEIRVGQKSKTKPVQSLLLYKNARVDMALLDETLGAENWQRDHKELKGVIYCGVSVRDTQANCWVTKWDAGAESNQDAQKGEASDSFKRACVNWGIGRELYTAPQIWVDSNISVYDLYVSRIAYNENGEIVDLAISNKNGVVWEMGKKTAPAAPVVQKGNVIRPEVKEAPKTQENGQRDELQAIYDSMDERELQEYIAAIGYMNNASTYQGALDVYKRYRDARFAPLLIEHGSKIKTERGW